MKLSSDLNNRFQKQGDTYIYKPKYVLVIMNLFMLMIYTILVIIGVFLSCERIIHGTDEFILAIITIVIFILSEYLLVKFESRYYLAISMNKNGCELSWLFYKKKISWEEFKVIKYESYENYKHRKVVKRRWPFPYKGCIIFSIDDYKKKITRDPVLYLKKPFSWFYINFYDEKDVEKCMRYEYQEFVFDEDEFMSFAKEIGLQIQDYPGE